MIQNNKTTLFMGLGLFVFMLTSLLLMSQSLQNSELFERYYMLLLACNATGLFILIALISLNLKNLINQLKNNIVGSYMTRRMVVIFSLLSVIPVLIVYYFSLDFLHRGIDSWFDLRVEQALDDSLELSQLALDVRMRELLKTTEKVSTELTDIDDTTIPSVIDTIRSRINAYELTILTKKGAILASNSTDTRNLIPDTPSETILLQLSQGNSYIGLDMTKGAKLLIRTVVNLPAIDIDKKSRIVQILYPISERINKLAENVQSSFIQYKELSYMREQLKVSFIIILTLVLLFSIFTAVWAAFYSANNLVAPIKSLAEGTHAITEGNYDTKLQVSSNDELGVLVTSFNDMTDKLSTARDTAKRSQEEAEAQHAYLETVLSHLSSGVVVFDSNGNLDTLNISASQILGINVANDTQNNIHSLMKIYPNLSVFFICIQKNIEGKLNDWYEQVTLTKRTGEQILMIRGTTLENTRLPHSGHIIVFDEVTALIKGQRDAAWSEMARRLAHEIKNPLTPIQLAAERLRHKYLKKISISDSDTLDRMTNTIIQQVETMKEMVNDFSNYARPPAFNPEKIQIGKLIQESLDLFCSPENGNQIITDIEVGLPGIIGDEKKMRQVFNNLLKNATDANSLVYSDYIKINAKRVSLEEGDAIEIRIIDKGTGIGDKDNNKLFEPYITTKQKGTGLGLAIVQKIIDEHKGGIWLENNEGQGACAVILLPVNALNSHKISSEIV